MKTKFSTILIGLIVLSILLVGCTSETKGNVSAPTGGQTGGTGGQTQKDTYSLGETVKPQKGLKGLEITLTKMQRIENCTSDGDCVGAYVKLKNTAEKELEAAFVAPVLLDDQGKQYEKIYTSYCPNEYETTLNKLYPGATKEGYLCFSNVPESAKTVKAILKVGLFDQATIVYQLNASQIRNAAKKAELTINDVTSSYTPATDYSAGYGTVESIKMSIKNIGEVYLKDLQYDYTIKYGTESFVDEKDVDSWTTVEPGKTEDASLTGYKRVGTVGDYTLEVVLKDKKGELARATKTFTVG